MTINIMTRILLIVFFTNLVLCTNEEESCVKCKSVAFRIELQNSQDYALIKNARIIAINKTVQDTIIIDSLNSDSLSHYVIFGIPGDYSLSISHPLYSNFSVNSIIVTQWSEVTCEHANTEKLKIRLEKLQLNKSSKKKSGEIISRITKGHC